jgi:hypothetical protein
VVSTVSGPLFFNQWLYLTFCSYFVLQFDYLRECWLHRSPGVVRLPRIRCHPGRVDNPYLVLDRYKGSSNFDPDCEFVTVLQDMASVQLTFPSLQTFPLMCIFLLAAGLSLLNSDDNRSRGEHIGPVVL